MERASAEAAYQELHEKLAWHDGTFTKWGESYSRAHPYPAMAGVTIGAALEDVTPHDEFTTKVSAAPIPPSVDGDPTA